MKPVIKWVGGKAGNLSYIKEMLPPGFNPDSQMYYEPFLGGGAVLLELNPVQAVVSDINSELINMYEQIKSNVEGVISYLNTLDYWHDEAKDKKAYYYRIREDFNVSLRCNTPSQAARFIYLNKHCFNGLYRVNKKGQFNVPFNGKLSGGSFDAEHLRAVSKQLQNVQFMCGDFAWVATAEEGSLVYLDPPYDPVSTTSNFTGYAAGGFDKDEQERLCLVCNQLDKKGIRFMLSNSATPFIKELYSNFNITIVKAKRAVNSKGDRRGEVEEVVVRNYE